MLNFDEQRFLRIQSGAVSLADGIHETVGRLSHKGRRTCSSWGPVAPAS